jgi:hypothetical protein
LDEVESLVGAPGKIAGNRAYVPEFFGMLRSIVQENPNFNVVLAGLTSSVLESGVLYGRENPLFAWARPYYVPPLESAEAYNLITQLGRRMALFWEPEALEEVYRHSEGHVFLLRSLSAHVAAAVPREGGGRTVSADLVRASFRPWRRGVAEQVKQMMSSLERFYPDAAGLLSLFREGLVDAAEADESYPSQLDQLLKLGLLVERGHQVDLTAFSRLAGLA